MADSKLRQLERQWQNEPTDTNAHARYLSALLRMGTLEVDRILATALWGHKGARAMLAGDTVKPDAIIYNGKRISTIETRDVIRGSEHLSSDATRRIALGIIKLCIDHLVIIERASRKPHRIVEQRLGTPIFNDGYSPMNVDLGTAVVYAEAYLSGNCDNDQLWKVLRKINNSNSTSRPSRFGASRRAALERIIYNCCIDIAAAGACHKIPLAAVAWFTDEQILEAVRAELYLWALGDAK